ncbi:MAG: hypothetical protein ABFS86_11890 [Planctomycetota bacterium]
MSTKLNMSRFLHIDGETSMRFALLPVVCLLLASCVTETTVGGARASSRDEAPRDESPAPAKERDPGDTVKLPPEVMKELIGFVNRKHFLLADHIEVDASRVPFQSAMVPVNDKRYVETVEMGNVAKNAVGILIRSKSKRPLVERDFPKLRVGDGLDLVANREIKVRTYNDIDRNRPVFLQIRGVGHAVYRDEATGKRIEKDAIAIRAEVVKGRNGMEFRSKIL